MVVKNVFWIAESELVVKIEPAKFSEAHNWGQALDDEIQFCIFKNFFAHFFRSEKYFVYLGWKQIKINF